MNKKKGMTMRNTNRMLILAVIIISISVIAFSVVSIVNTDNLAQYVEATYNNSYTLTVNVMRMKSILTNSRETMYDMSENPDSSKSKAGLERLYENRNMEDHPVGVLYGRLGDPERVALREDFGEIQRLNDEIIALSQKGQLEEARQFLEEAEPIYERLDLMLEELINHGTAEIEDYVQQSHDLNAQTNRVVYILSVVVIGLSLATSISFARIISSRNNEIYQRETLFNIIMENVDEVFIVYDGETGEVQLASQNAERMLGLDIHPGMNNYEILKRIGADVYRKIEDAYGTDRMKEVLDMEYEFIHAKTNEKMLLRSKIYPYYDKTQERYQLVSVTQDITKDKQAQEVLLEALQEAEHANAVKRDFLSRASHDLKTPINAIMGMKAIAEISIDDKEKTRNCLEKIDIAAKHLLDLVDEVLDMSRLESGRMNMECKPLDLDKLIDDVSSIIYPRAIEQKLHFHAVKEDMMQKNLIGNETGIRQILLNFLTNAVKFTEEGGNITLFVRQHDLSGKSVFTRFTVRDDGIGMAESFLEKIFLPFEQEAKPAVSKYSGAGLGMSISKSLAVQMGGDITVMSEEGRGSEFSFDLKMDIQSADLSFRERRTKPIEEFDFTGKRILIVEDNDINMEIADELMKTVGFTTELASNGKIAVELFESSPEFYYDIVLMDVHMPEMGGTNATRAIRALPREDATHTPIVAMTANASHESINESISSGMDAHITKPIMPQEVMAVLEEQLYKYRRQ